MKKSNLLIIGLIAMGIYGFSATEVKASYCDDFTLETAYKQTYCELHTDNNKKADKKVIQIVADQFDLKPDLVEAILDDTACVTVGEVKTDEAQETGERKVIEACQGKDNSNNINEVLFIENYLSEVKNTYEKEKAMYLKSKAIEMKFKASEDYWDGKLVGENNIPFDLSVDLNLIDIVLFGSKATWKNDVFQFPNKEEEGDENDIEDDLPSTELEEGTPIDDELETGGAELTGDGSGLPAGCVPLDDPDADPGAQADLFCGNNVIDVLMGEQCDDGNKENGDGCNDSCQEEALGSTDICKDPEAITFKDPVKPGEVSETPLCPEGSTVSKFPEINGLGAEGPNEVVQSNQYPGPSLGGTLKQFPESQRPACPDGYSEYKVNGENGGVSAEGNETIGINIAGTQFDAPKCIPNQFCADLDAEGENPLNKARDFLFGEGWIDDENRADLALSVTALFCVDVIKNNRPLSPYNINEGCIDCHVRAINDSLAKTLEGSPTPKENTMSAFAISSRFGPNMSFNLNTGTKIVAQKNRKNSTQESEKKDQEKTNLESKVETPEEPTFNETLDTQSRIIAEKNEHNKKLALQISANGARNDLEFNARVAPLLRQMERIFTNIQGKYNGMNEIKFNELNACVIQ